MRPAGRLLAPLLVCAACACAPAPPTRAAAPKLQVSGNRLVDAATGATFVPRGVNWPSFQYACYWGYGYSNERGPASVGPDDQDAANMATWHINTVRLPLNQDCWLGDEGLPHSDGTTRLTPAGYRQAVQDWVARLHAHGLAVILDLHWGSGPDVHWAGRTDEGQKPMADERSDEFWASVAQAFRGDPSVMFDAFNEPYSRNDRNGKPVFDLTWDCWAAGGCQAPVENDTDATLSGRTYPTIGMRAIVAAIRGAGATQPILLAGRDYANDLGDWPTHRPPDAQIVASFHTYPGQSCDTVACWDGAVASVAAQVPVVTTELGQDDCRSDHVTQYMDWADRKGIGYLMWEWVLPDGQVVCGKASAYSLITDTNATPRAPVGTAFKDHLASLTGP